VGLSNFLELGLDLANSLVFKLFDFLKRAPDHAESLGVDSCGGQNLVGLGVFCLEGLLDGFKLLLKNEVAQASLAMHVVDDVVELLKELFLLLLDVLVLLQTHFVLPLDVLVLLLGLHDFLLLLSKLFTHFLVLDLFLSQASDLLFDVLKRLDNHVVVGTLDHLLTGCSGFTNFFVFEVSS